VSLMSRVVASASVRRPLMTIICMIVMTIVSIIVMIRALAKE
jgi:hypothetical protein